MFLSFKGVLALGFRILNMYENQNIQALVFFGKPLDNMASNGNALRGWNTDSKIDSIVDSVAGYLAVDKLVFSLDSEKNQRKFSISSKMNPRFDIDCAYNFISSLQALFKRHKISKGWSIQSSVDAESSADLEYKIELY